MKKGLVCFAEARNDRVVLTVAADISAMLQSRVSD